MKVTAFPDCPICASRVTSLVAEDVVDRVRPTFASYSVTTLADPNRYTLNPCGHEVRVRSGGPGRYHGVASVRGCIHCFDHEG